MFRLDFVYRYVFNEGWVVEATLGLIDPGDPGYVDRPILTDVPSKVPVVICIISTTSDSILRDFPEIRSVNG